MFFLILLCTCNENQRSYGKDELYIIDHHVHVFSQNLIEQLRLDFDGFPNDSIYPSEIYSNLQTLQNVNKTEGNLLISAGYVYSPNNKYGKGITDDSLRYDLVRKESDFLGKMILEDEDVVYGFIGIDPREEFAKEEIYRCHRQYNISGIKFHFQSGGIDLLDVETYKLVKDVVQFSASLGLYFIIHNNAVQSDSIDELVLKYVDLIRECESPITIIFAHGGGGGGFTTYTLNFLQSMGEHIPQIENQGQNKIYFELSAVARTQNYEGKLDGNKINRLIEFIGREKFLIGSDYPFVANYQETLRLLSQELGISDEDLVAMKNQSVFK